ncbi:major facilitator superfamily MFS_1 protein [Janthinobacterium sp. HH01]|uniref:MFS transporter n=1 Tax=Janthinobacterium sp. HH01 TaxID=1198452 RepID=UPI0002AEC92E|nr:MFS transporter [Janthinobacterium sp. HH01]ELX13759.1 major facilitator superfamily MFS_1 protein [Janthinobacterium sp. HH01]
MDDPKKLQRAALMRNHNFKWLLRGGVISMLGDQLTMVALPWLVLKLTGDTLALGLVIALMSIPRAIFILIGGAVVDRYSPKRVLMLSKYANAVLLGLLTLLVLNNQPTMTVSLSASLSVTLDLNAHLTLMIIYVLALGIGLAQAFGIPSGTSIMPQAIAAEHLQAANGFLMGLRQLSMLIGPLMAAGLLALSGNSGGVIADARGLAFAFGFDCLSFLASAWTLSKVGKLTAPPQQEAPQSVLRSVGAGLMMVWNDAPMRMCFIYWGIVSLFIGGSMQVAIPVLASEQLHGASTLGLLMGANGAGMLLGMAGAAVAGARLRFASFGTILLLVDGIAGLLVMPLGAVQAAWQAAVLMLVLGLLSGYMQVNVFTWIQRRVPPHMMGRAMSIFMFIFMGLAPLSAAVTGWVLTVISLSQLFFGGGIILMVFAALAYLLTPIRSITNTNNTPQPQ